MSSFINVDITNFDEEFERFKAIIQSNALQFISLDCEFTGIESSKYAEIHDFDSLQVRYAKIRQGASRFGLIQCGISLWFVDNQTSQRRRLKESTCNVLKSDSNAHPEAGTHARLNNSMSTFTNTDSNLNSNTNTATNGRHCQNNQDSNIALGPLSCCTFNFYLWKDDLLTSRVLWEAGDDSFQFQISSLNFLGKHHMDFNRVIRAGVSYANRLEVQRMAKHLIKDHGMPSKNQKSRNSMESHLARIRDWYSQKNPMTEWHNSAWHSSTIHSPEVMIRDKLTLYRLSNMCDSNIGLLRGDEPSFEIFLDIKGNALWFNELLCKYIQMELSDKVKPYLVHIDKNRTAVRVVRIEHVEVYERELLHRVQGFSRVIEAIIAAKKPIVGHIPILDIAHIYHSCIEPLPFNVADFQARLKDFFPCIIDTKILQNVHFALKGKSLEDAVDIMKKKLMYPPVNEIPESEKSFKHNAGWDAYLSGLLFTRLFYFRMNHPQHRNSIVSSFSDIAHIRGFVNRFFLIRSKHELRVNCTHKKFEHLDDESEQGKTKKPVKEQRYHYYALIHLPNDRLQRIFDTYTELQNGCLHTLDENNYVLRLKEQKATDQSRHIATLIAPSMIIPYSDFEEELCSFIHTLGEWRLPKEYWLTYVKIKYFQNRDDLPESLSTILADTSTYDSTHLAFEKRRIEATRNKQEGASTAFNNSQFHNLEIPSQIAIVNKRELRKSQFGQKESGRKRKRDESTGEGEKKIKVDDSNRSFCTIQ